MTTLRLSDTGGAAAADNTTPHLFDTPPHIERYRARGWPYASSMVLHAAAIVSAVTLGHYLTPPPRSAPPRRGRTLAHTFVFTGGGTKHGRRMAPKTPELFAGVADDAAASPLPPARGDSLAPDTRTVVVEKPPQPAFDPAIPAGEARLSGRRGDPSEAGLGSAAPTLRGVPAGDVAPGGLGGADVDGVRTAPSGFTVRPGIDDTGGDDGPGATPPHIQEPLPVPLYPPAARTRRLQGVVVLEVMLDSRGKAHVRGVLSDPLGFGIEEAATNAAESLKFTPARQGGRFVDAIVQVRVTFTLTGSATAVAGGA